MKIRKKNMHLKMTTVTETKLNRVDFVSKQKKGAIHRMMTSCMQGACFFFLPNTLLWKAVVVITLVLFSMMLYFDRLHTYILQ